MLGTAGSTLQTAGHRTGALGPLFIAPYCEVHSKGTALCINLGPKDRGRNAGARGMFVSEEASAQCFHSSHSECQKIEAKNCLGVGRVSGHLDF